MQITCTNCGAKIRVPDNAAGKKGKCPKCQTVMTIPAAGDPSADDLPKARAQEAVSAGGGTPFDFNEPADAPPAVKKSSKGQKARDEEDGDDDDVSESVGGTSIAKKGESKGLSLTSMILGISGLVLTLLFGVGGIGVGIIGAAACACPCGIYLSYFGFPISGIASIVGIILGVIGLKKGARGMAWTGIATSAASILLILVFVVITIVLPFLGVMVLGAAGAAAQP